MSGPLQGRVAIVTGAGRGIGREYAAALAGRGAAVVAADIDGGAAEAVAKELDAGGAAALGVRVDVSAPDSVAGMVSAALERFGSVDILVNNAAVYAGLQPHDPADIDVDEWDRVMAVNVRGPWLCASAVLPAMKERGYGRIVNQASIAAWGNVHLAHYATSKAALIGLTRSLAKAWGTHNVTVNAIAPGYIATEATLNLASRERLEAVAGLQAIHRVAEAGDLTGALLFLCSEESSFVTGQVLVVDGGIAMV